MENHCYVQIKTKHFVEEPTDQIRLLSGQFSKCMDNLIKDFPSILSEQRGILQFNQCVDDFIIELTSGKEIHNLSIFPDILLYVTVCLQSNGKDIRNRAEKHLRDIVDQHFEAPGIPDDLKIVVCLINTAV